MIVIGWERVRQSYSPHVDRCFHHAVYCISSF